jgi:hypothetical protein
MRITKQNSFGNKTINYHILIPYLILISYNCKEAQKLVSAIQRQLFRHLIVQTDQEYLMEVHQTDLMHKWPAELYT